MRIIKKIERMLGRKPTKKEYPKLYEYFKKSKPSPIYQILKVKWENRLKGL